MSQAKDGARVERDLGTWRARGKDAPGNRGVRVRYKVDGVSIAQRFFAGRWRFYVDGAQYQNEDPPGSTGADVRKMECPWHRRRFRQSFSPSYMLSSGVSWEAMNEELVERQRWLKRELGVDLGLLGGGVTEHPKWLDEAKRYVEERSRGFKRNMECRKSRDRRPRRN